ncbi:uncharacterized protein BX664DRAFT_264158, partial [Halteromyces radiatus]|uniref:uncharacterized protein n=1 Tax=Halteromyces radiatus TaxID=101107 RepID=UPI00221F20D7
MTADDVAGKVTTTIVDDEDYSEKQTVSHSGVYFLLLVVQPYQVQILYFSKSDQSPRILVDIVTNKISAVERQTNQRLLLTDLQEKRYCSPYLEAPSVHETSSHPSEKSSASDSSSNDENDHKDTIAKKNLDFSPGEFQCPNVYRKVFPLHWRVPSDKALRYLKNDVLRPFTVLNRSDIYVVERAGTIVYCKIYEKLYTDDLTMDGEGDSGKKKETQDSKNILAGTTKTSPIMTTQVSVTTNELEMIVFGLECPDWITYDFVDLIENRLLSEVTLVELQTFFARNPTSKPTPSDVRFILPLGEKPPQRHILCIPSLVTQPSLLLGFFKRFLMRDNIKPFKGPSVISAIDASSYGALKNEDQLHEQQNMDNNDMKSDILRRDDLCFYYNCTKRIPGVSSPLELACGQGMAGICMTIRDATKQPLTPSQETIITQFPPHHRTLASTFHFDPDLIRQCLESDLCLSSSVSSSVTTIRDDQYHIWVDLWSIGSVDGTILLQYIHNCFRQALCDYFIEETVTIDLGTVVLYQANALQKAILSSSTSRQHHPSSHRQLSTLIRKKFIDSIIYMLRKSVEWRNPTVHSISTPEGLEIQPWCMKEVISDLEDQLIHLDPSLEPTVTWK